MAFSDWSTTATSNGSVLGIDIAENCASANLNNGLREAMAQLRAAVSTALTNFLAGTAGLPVANGGTGATTAADALTSLGALEDDYRDLPIVTKTTGWTFANADRSKGHNYTGGTAAATINPNSSTAINVGAVFVGRNNGSGTLTITRGSGVTLKRLGSTTSADAAVPVGAGFTLIQWAADDWSIS